MSKVIGGLILIALIFGGYLIFQYYKKVESDQATQKTEKVEYQEVDTDALSGMPSQLENSFRTAKTQGTKAIGDWLKAYGNHVQDPRRAGIELDYMVMLARENPAAAKKLFADIKARTPSNSPLWPRVQKLSPIYE